MGKLYYGDNLDILRHHADSMGRPTMLVRCFMETRGTIKPTSST